MTTATETLLTAEEFANLPDDGMRRELVRGKVTMTPPPGFEHGLLTIRLGVLIQPYLDQQRLGRLVAEAGTILTRQPDTVRGPDLSYYSYVRLPGTNRPRSYPNVLPEVVFEIRSPNDSWPEVMQKVAEYLAAGIIAVVIDPVPRTVHLFEPNQAPRQLGPADPFALPNLWPGLSFAVGDLFV